MQDKILKFTKFLILLFFISLWGYLIFKNFALSGKFVISYDLKHNAPLISNLKPVSRLADDQESRRHYKAITAEPIFFDFKLPPWPKFKKVKVSVVYKTEAPIFEIGTLLKNGWQIDVRTVQNDYLENLNWSKIQKGNAILYQKEKKYEAIENFLEDFSNLKSVATFHADLIPKITLENYQPNKIVKNYEVFLRGEHKMAVYAANEPILIDFLVQDVNRQEGEDPIEITVTTSDNKIIWQKSLPDDGIRDGSAIQTDLKTISVSTPVLPANVYFLNFKANDDIFIRKISTSIQKFVFLKRLFLADSFGYPFEIKPVTVWTNAKRLLAKTPHAEGIQTLKIGEETLEIREPQEFYAISLNSKKEVVPVTSPLQDVELQTDGVFAFESSAFFNPLIEAVNWDVKNDVGYLFVKNFENFSLLEDGWHLGQAVFELDELYQKNNRLTFFFFIPGMDINYFKVLLRQIQIELVR
jgi:hypothetical protein